MEKTVMLNENKDFRRVYHRAKSQVHPLLVTYAVKNNRSYNRMGITATKKIGKACKRNRARRLIREAYRQLEATAPTGWDLVFVARARTTLVKMDDVLAAMRTHLEKLA